MKKLHFKVLDHCQTITPCPLYENDKFTEMAGTMIGSRTCTKCRHNNGINLQKHTVKCTAVIHE